jgi:hypothetical protein
MTSRFATALALGLLLLGTAGDVSAEQRKLIGTITSVDAETGTVAVAESNGARTMTFHVGDKSRVTDRTGRKGVSLDALSSGDAVSVSYQEPEQAGADPEVSHMQVTVVTPRPAATDAAD